MSSVELPSQRVILKTVPVPPERAGTVSTHDATRKTSGAVQGRSTVTPGATVAGGGALSMAMRSLLMTRKDEHLQPEASILP